MIRTVYKDIADKYDISLIEDGMLMYKPLGRSDLDKHGIDAIDNGGLRVDTKYPETVDNFYFQASKILDDDYIWTEAYWYVFHDSVYKWRREKLKALVKQYEDLWEMKHFSDGYFELRLSLNSIGGDPMKAMPDEVAPLPVGTAKVIEKDILKKNGVKINGVSFNTLRKWISYSKDRQNYSCEDVQLSTDGCYRYKKYVKTATVHGSKFVEVPGVYYKIPEETAEQHKVNNKLVYTLSRDIVESLGREYHV